MTFFDFLKDVIDSGKERLKTPITGAFVFSFLVWNWRPLAVLFFSDASIEDKILVVNYEYCTGWAIIFPIFIALFYTLLVPKIMVEINKDLAPTKNKRVDDIYDAKSHTTDRKIELAKREFELKNIETGNKQIEELLSQIDNLKESNTQITKANQIEVEQLNENLKKSNEQLKETLRDIENGRTLNSLSLSAIRENKKNQFSSHQHKYSETNSLENTVIEILNALGDNDLNQFKKLRRLSDGEIEEGSLRSIKQETINHFILMGFISPKENQFYFTNNGEILYNILRAN